MTDKEQTEAFSNDLNSLIERYRKEFEITYAQIIGTMQIKIIELVQEGNEE